jgi:hypothetical protein
MRRQVRDPRIVGLRRDHDESAGRTQTGYGCSYHLIPDVPNCSGLMCHYTWRRSAWRSRCLSRISGTGCHKRSEDKPPAYLQHTSSRRERTNRKPDTRLHKYSESWNQRAGVRKPFKLACAGYRHRKQLPLNGEFCLQYPLRICFAVAFVGASNRAAMGTKDSSMWTLLVKYDQRITYI